MAPLKTRKPTGAVPWPLILIEGGEKVGKSWICAEFSGSSRIGQTYWIDFGEGAADEYGAIPGANYLIVEHDGTFGSLYGAVEAVYAEAERAAKAGEKPVVLVIDSMTAEWDVLKDWATSRAAGSQSNKKKLAQDPLADIVVSNKYWNDANSRHRKLMRLLMTFPGIALMTARGKDVAAIGEGGQPIEGKKEYRVEGQKNLGFDATCWIRLYRDQPGTVVGLRSVHHGLRPGRDEPKRLPADWSVEWLVFDTLKCDPAKAHVRDLVEVTPERTPEQVRDWALEPTVTFEELGVEYRRLVAEKSDTAEVTNEHGDEEQIGEMLKRLAKERAPRPVEQVNGRAAAMAGAAS